MTKHLLHTVESYTETQSKYNDKTIINGHASDRQLIELFI